MLAFAYAECGLNVDQFFNLSFYEWSLEVYKVKKRQERLRDKWEGEAAFVREILLAVYNSAGKIYKRNFEREDFYKLSFDTVKKKVETREMTPEEIKKKFGKALKNGK